MKQFLIICCICFGNLAIAQKMNIHNMKAGYCFASGMEEDSTAFAAAKLSANYPCIINNIVPFSLNEISLVIFKPPWIEGVPDLLLCNGLQSPLLFHTTDSRLPIVAEAKVNGEWKLIEYLPEPVREHQVTVALPSIHYWSFRIPEYSGEITTMIRYKLSLPDGSFIYSNEVRAGISKEQLSMKEETIPEQQRKDSSEWEKTQSKLLNIRYKKMGNCLAASRIPDTTAAGGFGSSDNFSKTADNRVPFMLFYVTLKLFRESKEKPWALYLTNGMATEIAFPALDSRLNILAEAWVEDKWQPIEYIPGITCGNSKHQLVLPAKEYWKFEIPQYEGSIATRIRYRLQLPDGNLIYSNEIPAGINKEQLTITEETYRSQHTKHQ